MNVCPSVLVVIIFVVVFVVFVVVVGVVQDSTDNVKNDLAILSIETMGDHGQLMMLILPRKFKSVLHHFWQFFFQSRHHKTWWKMPLLSVVPFLLDMAAFRRSGIFSQDLLNVAAPCNPQLLALGALIGSNF